MNSVLLLDPSWRIDRIISIERACELLVAGQATAASEEIAMVMHSPSIEVIIPTVIARLGQVHSVMRRPPICSARRVRVRDEHVCQFVVDGRPCTRAGDSADHLVPQCRGGRSTWTNLVAACREHNGYKRDRSLVEMHAQYGWTLRREPIVPSRQAVVLGDVRGLRPGWELFLAYQ
jgi:5-methylcytosine-specific restriction endonuclease McrA